MYLEPTDKLGADVPNPKSHICYGFATHVVILDDDGRVSEVYAAHDSGKVVNPISIQGQIEGGVLMGMGYALTEDWPLKDCVPQARYGTLGLFRAPEIPDIHAIYVEKDELLPVAYGGKGIGEIATIPTRPPCRTPIAHSTASCVRICHGGYAVQPRSSPRVGWSANGHCWTGCSRSTSTVYAAPLAPVPSRAGAFCLERRQHPGIGAQNGVQFPERSTCGGVLPPFVCVGRRITL